MFLIAARCSAQHSTAVYAAVVHAEVFSNAKHNCAVKLHIAVGFSRWPSQSFPLTSVMFPSTSVIREGMIYIVTKRDSESWKCKMVSSKVMDKVCSKPGKGICFSNFQFCILSYLLFCLLGLCGPKLYYIRLFGMLYSNPRSFEICEKESYLCLKFRSQANSCTSFNRKFYGKYSVCLQMGARSFSQHGSNAGFSSNCFKM